MGPKNYENTKIFISKQKYPSVVAQTLLDPIIDLSDFRSRFYDVTPSNERAHFA